METSFDLRSHLIKKCVRVKYGSCKDLNLDLGE